MKKQEVAKKMRGNEYHLSTEDKGVHRIYNKGTGQYERHYASKNYAGHSLKYKNTNLEFGHSVSQPYKGKYGISAEEKSERRHITKSHKPMREE